MLKFINGMFTSGSAAEEDVSHGFNGTDAAVSVDDLLAQVHTRHVPVLHIEDDMKNSRFNTEYKLLEELGAGLFAFSSLLPTDPPRTSFRESMKSGSAKRAAIALSGKSVACRVYVSSDDDYNVNYVFKELEVLRRLYSPYVQNLYAHYEAPTGHRLIVDYFEGDLSTVIASGGYCELYVAGIIKQVLLGVVHLHSVGVVHRRITPKTILVSVAHPNRVAHVKLSGFGNAVVLPAREAASLFGLSSFNIKGGFSMKNVLENRSSRGNRSGEVFARAETMDPIVEQSFPTRDSADQETSNESATILLHAQLDGARAITPPQTSSLRVDTAFQSNTIPTMPETVESLQSPGPHLVKMDTFDQPVRLITRPTASSKYKYSTSVAYSEVPYKSYDKIKESIEGEAFADLSLMAPEMISGQYGPQVDAWAVGCVAYQLLLGHVPFTSNDGCNSDNLAATIMSGVYPTRGNIWRSLSDLSKLFVGGLIVVNPFERLCPEESLMHQWITDTTLAAAQSHRSSGRERVPYTFIITPRRSSLKSILGKSRTSSNVSTTSIVHDMAYQLREVTSPDEEPNTLLTGTDVASGEARLSSQHRLETVPMEPDFDDDSLLHLEDEQADMMFNEF